MHFVMRFVMHFDYFNTFSSCSAQTRHPLARPYKPPIQGLLLSWVTLYMVNEIQYQTGLQTAGQKHQTRGRGKGEGEGLLQCQIISWTQSVSSADEAVGSGEAENKGGARLQRATLAKGGDALFR